MILLKEEDMPFDQFEEGKSLMTIKISEKGVSYQSREDLELKDTHEQSLELE